MLAYTRTVSAVDGEFTTMIQTHDANGAPVVSGRNSFIGRDPGLASVPTGGFALIAMPSNRSFAPPEPLRAGVYNNAAEPTGAGDATTTGRNPALAGSGRGHFLAVFEAAETADGVAAGSGIRALLFNEREQA